MQEEVENRTVNLAVTTTRMTARAILSGIRTYLYYHNHNRVNDPYKHGKKSVKDLIGQGQGVESIEVGDESLRTFNRIARSMVLILQSRRISRLIHRITLHSLRRRMQMLCSIFWMSIPIS